MRIEWKSWRIYPLWDVFRSRISEFLIQMQPKADIFGVYIFISLQYGFFFFFWQLSFLFLFLEELSQLSSIHFSSDRKWWHKTNIQSITQIYKDIHIYILCIWTHVWASFFHMLQSIGICKPERKPISSCWLTILIICNENFGWK